jgi:hypothetical protein
MESLIDNAENTLEKIKESKGITEEEKGEEDIHTEPDEQ